MPRKIPDLEHTLVESASQIFVEKGYTEVSMKDVAAAAGTSVGNLYNYFPSKKELFIAGRKLWLERSKDQFSGDALAGKEPLEALKTVLFQLLDQMQSWNGVFEEFLENASRELTKEEIIKMGKEARAGIMDSIVRPVDILVRKIAANNPRLQLILGENDLRLSCSLLSTLKMLVRFYPKEKMDNQRYLSRVLDDLLAGNK